MRHRKRTPKLGRTSSHREAMLENMVSSLLVHQRVRTTHTKAAAARRLADRMITLGKQGSVAARRRAYAVLKDRTLVKTLFDEVAPLYKNRTGGYTRVLRLDARPGDAAPMALLELVEKRAVETRPRKDHKDPAAPKPKPDEEKTPASEASPKQAPSAPKKAVQKPERKSDKQKGLMGNIRKFFRRRGGP